MDPVSDFQSAMVEYLEGVHQGEFINGTIDLVAADIQKRKENNPTYTVYALLKLCPGLYLPNA